MKNCLCTSSVRHYLHLIAQSIKRTWGLLRRLSGDDAYEQYLQHYAKHYFAAETQTPPLSRAAFFKAWQSNKWDGIKRCC